MRPNYSTDVLIHKGFRENSQYFKVSHKILPGKELHNIDWKIANRYRRPLMFYSTRGLGKTSNILRFLI